MVEIYAGKQHYIENFDFKKFYVEYRNLPYEGQRGLIESFDVSTNPEWKELKRGVLGASSAHDFMSDSLKVANMKRGKGWKELTEKEKEFKLAEIPLEERLGESCKKLAYRILAERRTSWREPDASWSDRVQVKRGLVFEAPSVEIYKKAENLKDENIVDILFIKSCDLVGFSPDKLILKGTQRVALEIKNFEPPAFYKAVADAEKPETIEQVQWQIMAGNLERVDVLYCSQEDGTYKIVKYGRDESKINEFKKRLKEFEEYLTILEDKVKSEVVSIKF